MTFNEYFSVSLGLVVLVDDFTYPYSHVGISTLRLRTSKKHFNGMKEKTVEKKDELSRHGNDTLYEHRKNASRVHVESSRKPITGSLHVFRKYIMTSTRSTALTVAAVAAAVTVQHYYSIRSLPHDGLVFAYLQSNCRPGSAGNIVQDRSKVFDPFFFSYGTGRAWGSRCVCFFLACKNYCPRGLYSILRDEKNEIEEKSWILFSSFFW